VSNLENSQIADIQNLYAKLELDFESLKDNFMDLEKAYYNLTPIYEKIQNTFDKILNSLQDKKSSGLSRRIVALKEVLLDLKSKRSYDIKTFQNIFLLLNKIVDKSASEIVPPKFLETLTKRIENEVIKNQQIEKAKKIKFKKNSTCFLMLKDHAMKFLISIKNKVWQGKVNNKKNVKIRFKFLENKNLINFDKLPGQPKSYNWESGSSVEKKIAILYTNEKNVMKGILADKLEGLIYLGKKLLEEKKEYLEYDNKKYEPYITLKGSKYYIIEN